ncbi:MAG: hypothetical protein EOP67_13365, partial [Sphingomonas sp.]
MAATVPSSVWPSMAGVAAAAPTGFTQLYQWRALRSIHIRRARGRAMETLAQWSYVSSSMVARADFAFEVRRIVLVSRSRNAASLLTGALVSSTTRFLQYLE